MGPFDLRWFHVFHKHFAIYLQHNWIWPMTWTLAVLWIARMQAKPWILHPPPPLPCTEHCWSESQPQTNSHRSTTCSSHHPESLAIGPSGIFFGAGWNLNRKNILCMKWQTSFFQPIKNTLIFISVQLCFRNSNMQLHTQGRNPWPWFTKSLQLTPSPVSATCSRHPPESWTTCPLAC